MISRTFCTPWGIRTPGLLVRRLSQGKIGVISAPICAFYHHSFGGFSIVSIQPCLLQFFSGSKVGQAQFCNRDEQTQLLRNQDTIYMVWASLIALFVVYPYAQIGVLLNPIVLTKASANTCLLLITNFAFHSRPLPHKEQCIAVMVDKQFIQHILLLSIRVILEYPPHLAVQKSRFPYMAA